MPHEITIQGQSVAIFKSPTYDIEAQRSIIFRKTIHSGVPVYACRNSPAKSRRCAVLHEWPGRMGCARRIGYLISLEMKPREGRPWSEG